MMIVPKKHYYSISYLKKERFINYYNQLKFILKTNPKSLLEIGVGNKLLSYLLKEMSIKVTTCDIDKKLKPDVVGDIKELPFKDKCFDTVVAFEVLEHIPFDFFEKSLLELKRVSKKNVIISLPLCYWYFSLNISSNIRFLRRIKNIFLLKIPKFFYKINFNSHGQHHWEVGSKGYPIEKIRTLLRKYFIIEQEYVDPQDPYHIFFVLSLD